MNLSQRDNSRVECAIPIQYTAYYICLLPRDAMQSADYAVTRRLSVCPSVRNTPVLCRNGKRYRDFFHFQF